MAFTVANDAAAQSSIAAGGTFSLIVKPDGTVWAFGSNSLGQIGDTSLETATWPTQVNGLSNIQSVAGGQWFSLALTTGGNVYARGHNSFHQLGDGTTTNRYAPVLLSLTNVIAIEAGKYHSLALTADGKVYAWGSNAYGESGGPTTNDVTTPTVVMDGDVVAISAGRLHSLAVKSDGTVWAWGSNAYGQLGNGTTGTTLMPTPTQVPNVSGAIAVSGGEFHSLFLLNDGTVKAVGYNGTGNLGNGQATPQYSAVPVSILTNITKIAAGSYHNLALKDDGTVWVWGVNTQLGTGGNTNALTPLQLPGLSGASAIAATAQLSVVLMTDGSVYTWGTSNLQGDGTQNPHVTPVAISGPGYVWNVATPVMSSPGGSFVNSQSVTMTTQTPGATIHYTTNGTTPTESDPTYSSTLVVDYSLTLKARAWKSGLPTSGIASSTFVISAAQPTTSPAPGTWTNPATVPTVTFSTTTPGASIRYTTDGSYPTASSTLYTGPFVVDHTTYFRIAAFKTGLTPSTTKFADYIMNFGQLATPVVEPAAGTYTGSVTMVPSTIDSGVARYTSVLGTGTPSAPTISSPTGPLLINKTTTVRVRSFSTDYQPSAGEVTRTYTIIAHTPTLGTAAGSYAPGSTVTITAGDPIDTLRMTIDGSDPITTSPVVASGTTIALGNFTLKVKAWRTGALDSAIASATYTLTSALGPGSATAGGGHNVIATPDGRLIAWGRNSYGQLGDDTSTNRVAPITLNTLTGVTQVAGGSNHTLARTSSGQVYGWGSNGSGRLGDGTTSSRYKPTLVTTLSNIVAVAAGDAHSLALTSDGHVYAWGNNTSGELGIGTTPSYTSTPTLIPTLSNVVAIAAGTWHSFAVTSTGQLYGWGYNTYSQVGGGSGTQYTPLLINVSNVVSVAAGSYHGMALTSSGAVYSWGYGGYGALGRVNPPTTPTLIPSLHASAIAAGDNFSAAIRGDGVLVAWGQGTYGQIGDTFTTQRNSPVVVSGPASITTLALGDTHALAVTPTGDVWTWGDDADGGLGDGGANTNRATPQSVMIGLSNWAAAAPTVSAASQTFASPQTVTLTSSISGAVIRYNVNGTEPTESDAAAPANGQISIDYSSLLRAKAFVTGRLPGPTVRADYQMASAAPVISPATGNYTSAQSVTLTASGPPAVIRYTIDGSDPTASSTAYSAPFNVGTLTTVKAKAFPTNGWAASATSAATLTFNLGTLAPPTAVAAGGIFAAAPSVTLSSIAGASIRYTLNGSTPTSSSTLYTGAITIPTNQTTLKSIAFHQDWTASPVRTDVYTIDTTPPSIVERRFPAPLNSWHMTPVTISFSCADDFAVGTCSGPTIVSAEGIGQPVTGIAIDSVGNQASQQATVNIDLTKPTLELTSPSDGLITTSTTLNVTGNASDELSGLAGVKCNGVAGSIVEGAATCTVPLRPGRNVVALTASDLAGNVASASVTVIRVGNPTAMQMTPSDRTMVVDDSATLSLLDDYGVPVSGALWSTSDSNVVALSTTDPPTLSAISTGTAYITATKSGMTGALAIVTVSEGATLAEGAKYWTVSPLPLPNLRPEPPIYANNGGAGPDAYIVEMNTATWDRIVRPVTVSGEVQALIAAPGIPLMGDTFGGLLAGVEPAPDTCRAIWGEVEQCYTALVRFAGPSGTAAWRYDSPGFLDRPAQAPDGTIYVIEHIADIGSVSKSIVILNGSNGAVTARIPLANFIVQSTGCESLYGESEPKTAGPIVGSDGLGYVAVSNRVRQISYSASCSSYSEVMDVGMSLLRLSSAGQIGVTAIDQRHCTTECSEPEPKQLLPDGLNGLIAIAEYRFGPVFNAEWKMTRIDSEGAQSTTTVGEGVRIELIGPAGAAYLNTKQVVDLQTSTPLWALPAGWNWLAAANNGDGFAERNGEVARFGPAGQIGGARQLNLLNPSPAFGGWAGIQGVGNATTGGLTAYAMPFDYGTRWDETYRQWGFGVEERRGYGDQSFRSVPQLVFHTNYNAIEIETSLSPETIFDRYVRTYAGVEAGPYASVSIPDDAISAVGQRVTFTMKPWYIRLVQDPFQVEAVRYVPSQNLIAATTINPNHPIFGWRYWHVFRSTNGITIETGAYDRPASGLLNLTGSFVAREDQTGIWREYMRHILQATGATLRSPVQLMNGIWDVDTNPTSASLAPYATRNYILTKVCGVAPTNLSLFELTRNCIN